MKEIYDDVYMRRQLEKFRDRANNHFANHIRIAKALVREYAKAPPARLLDLGCSIGTFALEFALDGYETMGLDFDERSLEQAKQLSKEMGVCPEWICADAAAFSLDAPVDVVVCFDLLEHLCDETIAKMLGCVRRNLGPGGVLVFHTFPTEYDHLFYGGKWTCLPLLPFRKQIPERFLRVVRGYANLLDVWYRLRYGKTHKQRIATTVHPNPLSRERLEMFLSQAGFRVVTLSAALDDINPLKPGQGVLAKRHFSTQPVAQRSLFGVAVLS